MEKLIRNLLIILFITVHCFVFSQNYDNGLILDKINQKTHYYYVEKSSKESQNINPSIFEFTLSNRSNDAYYIVIDTTTFNIFDELKIYDIHPNIELQGSPSTIFRPWLKIYNSFEKEVPSNFYFFQPDLELNFGKEKIQQVINQELENAILKYNFMATEERPDMPLFYYFLKKNQIILYPNESINISIPITLPVNYIDSEIWREYFVLNENENYKAVVEIDYTDNRLEKILTQEDKERLNKVGIKIFNGVLRSNEVELVPIRD